MMTMEQLYDRQNKLAKAFAMFPKIKDVAGALRRYNEILPEEERIPIFISTSDVPPTLNSEVNLLDLYGRPHCPECDSEMGIRQVPENPEGIKTQWVCTNENCDTVLSSEFDIKQWIDILREGYESRRDAGKGKESVQEG